MTQDNNQSSDGDIRTIDWRSFGTWGKFLAITLELLVISASATIAAALLVAQWPGQNKWLLLAFAVVGAMVLLVALLALLINVHVWPDRISKFIEKYGAYDSARLIFATPMSILIILIWFFVLSFGSIGLAELLTISLAPSDFVAGSAEYEYVSELLAGMIGITTATLSIQFVLSVLSEKSVRPTLNSNGQSNPHSKF